MNNVSLKQALEEQEHNAKLALQNPHNQREFMDEYLYSDPNNFDEMKELYTYYGYAYSRDLWALQQVAYTEAGKEDSND